MFGSQGYVIGGWEGSSGDLNGLPAGVTYALEQGMPYRWTSPTPDVRSLQSPTQLERRTSTWYHATQVRLRLTFSAAYTGTLHLYALDWDTTTRRESVTVNDGSGPRTLVLASSFNPGAWLHFPVSVSAGGSVTVTVDRTAGPNAVLSGMFLGLP